jgi:hypothetical protein
MLRPIVPIAAALSLAAGWTVSVRAQEPPAGKEGVTRPAEKGREGVTRPGKADEHEHEHEHTGPKSSAPT